MAEWLMALVLKTSRLTSRRFESCPFRHVLSMKKKTKSTKETKITRNKKKIIIIISIIVSALLVLGGFLIWFLIWQEETKPVLIDDLSFEINSEVVNKDLLLEEYEIIDEENLETNELGEHEYTIGYKKDGREKDLTFTYLVVDTVKPEISVDDTYEITKGDSIDFKDKIKISDNSKEEIQPEVEGEYDVNKVGEYQLKAKAKDSSGNEVEKEFKLIVKEKPVEKKTTTSSSSRSYSSSAVKSYSGSSSSSSSQSYNYNEPAECKQFTLGQVVDAYYYSACKSIGIQQCNFYWQAEQVSEYTKYWGMRYNSGKCDPISSVFEAQSPKPSMDAWELGKTTGHRTLYRVIMSW